MPDTLLLVSLTQLAEYGYGWAHRGTKFQQPCLRHGPQGSLHTLAAGHRRHRRLGAESSWPRAPAFQLRCWALSGP